MGDNKNVIVHGSDVHVDRSLTDVPQAEVRHRFGGSDALAALAGMLAALGSPASPAAPAASAGSATSRVFVTPPPSRSRP